MRRSVTRNTTGQTNSDATDLFPSASSKASLKEMERIDSLFYSYVNKSSGMIDPEGIESLCSDIEVGHTDVRILIFAWKMKAEKLGYFTWEEWRRQGLKALRVDTVNKLKKALPELEKEVRRPTNFPDFYAYAFWYCLTEEKKKSVDTESVCKLLDFVLGSQYRVQVDYLIEYLKMNTLVAFCVSLYTASRYVSFKTQTDYKVINMDQWMGFYRFCNEISFPDFNNYDPNLAWLLILDNFVEWMKAKRT